VPDIGVEDERYFIELQDSGSIHILLTADYVPGTTLPAIGTISRTYPLQPSAGKARMLDYTPPVGSGRVTYFTLCHCHIPTARAARAADPTDTTPLTLRGALQSEAFFTLLLPDAIACGWP
jgi:hypothetical protein